MIPTVNTLLTQELLSTRYTCIQNKYNIINFSFMLMVILCSQIYIEIRYNLCKDYYGTRRIQACKGTEPNTLVTLTRHATNSNISLDFTLYDYARYDFHCSSWIVLGAMEESLTSWPLTELFHLKQWSISSNGVSKSLSIVYFPQSFVTSSYLA